MPFIKLIIFLYLDNLAFHVKEMVNLTSILTPFCLFPFLVLPSLLAFSSMTPNVSPLQLTLHMPGAGQMTPIGGVANQLLKPEDRIKDLHMRMNEKQSPQIPKDRKVSSHLLLSHCPFHWNQIELERKKEQLKEYP